MSESVYTKSGINTWLILTIYLRYVAVWKRKKFCVLSRKNNFQEQRNSSRLRTIFNAPHCFLLLRLASIPRFPLRDSLPLFFRFSLQTSAKTCIQLRAELFPSCGWECEVTKARKQLQSPPRTKLMQFVRVKLSCCLWLSRTMTKWILRSLSIHVHRFNAFANFPFFFFCVIIEFFSIFFRFNTAIECQNFWVKYR